MGIPVLAIKSLTGGGGGGQDPRVSGILEKIPDQATASNKLADKAFVNSSIATNTANYISNAGQPFTSASQLPTTGVTNNDYAFVTGTDEHGNTYFDRYKATVSGTSVTWAKEYRLNNSSFTAEQWSAIQSGITAALVGKLNGMKGVYEVDYTTAVSKYSEILAAFNAGDLVYMMYEYEVYICQGYASNTLSFYQATGSKAGISSDGSFFNIKITVYSLTSTKWTATTRTYSSSGVVTRTISDNPAILPSAKAVYDALALKANTSDVKTATAFTCEMANGTTKTLTMNGVLS